MICTISLEAPAYLTQWYVHRMDGEIPVKLKKNSPESNFLEMFLTKFPKDYNHTLSSGNDRIVIQVPEFKNRKPEYYSYLPPKAKQSFLSLLKVLFDVELFKDIYRFEALPGIRSNIIASWMEAKGIEDTETNTMAVTKRYQRLLHRTRDKERKKTSK